MKKFIKKTQIVKNVIIAALLLTVWQASAQEYYTTVSLDSISFNDTIVYCQYNDSIKLISPTGSTNVMWLINNYLDTIYGQALILPDGVDDYISCQFTESLAGGINFYIYPFSVEILEDTVQANCGNVQLNASTNAKSDDTISYIWFPSQYLDNAYISNPMANISTSMWFGVDVTNQYGCSDMDTVYVNNGTDISPEICMVTVNNSNKNVIIWKELSQNNIDSVFIYKETPVTDDYEIIGKVKFNNTNYFVDTTSNPDIQSNKYKVLVKDICGSESDLSDAHKTLHLSINQGQNNVWNLIWESYEGFDVSTYYIYRGTSEDSLVLIGTSSANNTQYSDLTAPEGSVHYQVEIVSPNNCSLLKSSSYSVSHSNIASFMSTTDINQKSDESKIKVYPSPCVDNISIIVDDYTNSSVKIINSNGIIVMKETITSLETTLNIVDLNTGLYFVQILTKTGSISKTIIKK
jgi:hypothetical protein